MKQLSLAPLLFIPLLVAATAGDAAADGPFSHISDGMTPPIIEYDGDVIVNVVCVPGSRCVTRTSATAPAAGARQTITLWFKTGASLATDHFAFGVRGNPSNGPCDTNPNLQSNPFWGRGLTIFPGATTKAKFENFTLNCVAADAPVDDVNLGIVATTSRTIAFLPNTLYVISVWADDVNTGYEMHTRRYNAAAGEWELIPHASGNCLDQADASDEWKCAKRPIDPPTANRTFIGSLTNLTWTVTNWFLH